MIKSVLAQPGWFFVLFPTHYFFIMKTIPPKNNVSHVIAPAMSVLAVSVGVTPAIVNSDTMIAMSENTVTTMRILCMGFRVPCILPQKHHHYL